MESGKLHEILVNIAQDIIYVASSDNILIPKSLRRGLYAHQTTRPKELIQVLHAGGYCVSYDMVH